MSSPLPAPAPIPALTPIPAADSDLEVHPLCALYHHGDILDPPSSSAAPLRIGGPASPTNPTSSPKEDDLNAVAKPACVVEDFHADLGTERHDAPRAQAAHHGQAPEADRAHLRGWPLAFGSALEVKALVEDVPEGLSAMPVKEAAHALGCELVESRVLKARWS
ncbi:hypothetical protein K523DRAFT_359066 [Schizophyllum commune Tattone D]|nr:hypothetical protein K523DRAFT_359066 [Schizophyllum commune Tattone D]